MLGPLDDTLWHQLPTTFDHVGTQRPALLRPLLVRGHRAGRPRDAAVHARRLQQHGRRRRRLRRRARRVASATSACRASLRPRFEPVCGPLRVEVLEPLRRFRLVAEPGDHPVHGELEWTGVLAPEEERPHFSRVRGRVSEEYQRFNQIGECSGRLDVEGTRLERRPVVGVPRPLVGCPTEHGDPRAGHRGAARAGHGRLPVRVPLLLDRHARRSRADRRARRRARLPHRAVPRPAYARRARPPRRRRATCSVEMVEGTRRFRHRHDRRPTLADGSGRRSELRADALGPSLAMTGLGYSGGFDDGRGLGVWRGVEHLESDVWDVRRSGGGGPRGRLGEPAGAPHPARPRHRDRGRSALDGEGTGSMTLIATGRLPRHGLDMTRLGPTTEAVEARLRAFLADAAPRRRRARDHGPAAARRRGSRRENWPFDATWRHAAPTGVGSSGPS